MSGLNIYLHVCCAPCLAKAASAIQEKYNDWSVGKLMFFNPNIQPLLEFRRRLKAFQVYLEREKAAAVIYPHYGLSVFVEKLTEKNSFSRPERCKICYAMRLDETARLAKAEGAGAFSTTLFASRQQNHELIREAGETAGKKHGINFLSADFRDALPPERLTRGLYKQQ